MVEKITFCARARLSRATRHPTFIRIAIPALGSVCFVAAENAAALDKRVKIHLTTPGVYRFTHDNLGGYTGHNPIPSSGIAISQCGREIPIRVVDGGDATFDRGDSIEFVAADDTKKSCPMILTGNSPGALRIKPPTTTVEKLPCSAAPPSSYFKHLHLEKDIKRVSLSRGRKGPDEAWVWCALQHVGRPFQHSFEINNLDRSPGRTATLNLRFFGRSRLPRKRHPTAKDHRVTVTINDGKTVTAEWNNREEGYTLKVSNIPARTLRDGTNLISVTVPSRTVESSTVIDSIFLDWIELTYPRTNHINSTQAELLSIHSTTSQCLALATESTAQLSAYTENGLRIGPQHMARVRSREHTLHYLPSDAANVSLHTIVNDGFKKPTKVEVIEPSNLLDAARQADYLMIAHASLIQALQPLVDFHRTHGLRVEVIDVEDVINEFGHGAKTPEAIRDFVRYTTTTWKKPAPRFLLLVGDASWHVNELPNPDTPDRNLVPTATHSFFANDNWLVADPTDGTPRLAVGRFPALKPAEISNMVDKSIRYMTAPPGPHRRKILAITSEAPRFQNFVDQLSESTTQTGFLTTKLYPPRNDENDDTANRDRVRSAFTSESRLAYFIGHGSRSSWRTAARDLDGMSDLFRIDDLDEFPATQTSPILLSMTCFSGPFAHPVDHSIAERLLLMDQSGASAVLASSWDNTPRPDFIEQLVERLTQSTRLGEAILATKQNIKSRPMRDRYNLLGDPALKLVAPGSALQLNQLSDGTRVGFRASIKDGSFDGGLAAIDWLDAKYNPVHSESRLVEGSTFDAYFEGVTNGETPVAMATVYVWNETNGVDGLASLRFYTATAPTK